MAISVNTPVSREAHRGHPGQNKRTGWTRRSLATTFLLVFLVYFLLPFFWLIVSTTKTTPDLFTSFGLWFSSDFNLFNNLGDLFTHDSGVFWTWLWNTAYYATCSAVGASLIATIAGYAFAKFHFPGRTLVFAIILGSIMVPSTALAIPTYLLLSKVGLVNTPLAVILPSLVSPFGVFLMRIYAEQAVPDELLDAARVDGAGEMRIFWSVGLRILVPGFVTVLLFSFVATWNNYFLPLLVLSDPTYYPLTLGLASWNAQASAQGGAQLLYTLVLTGSLISILPLIVAFLFLQRYWQGGLTLGSIRS
ncbi:MAG TPA: carbohydrate ABC transporter permease [Ktedonobacteraceae bacterium]